MNRHKLLALAAMLLVPLAACDEGTPPVPVGMIDGQVSIEGQGVDGVTVTMSTGAATTTANGGRFSFASVDGGTYTLTISNYPADASFTSTSQPATIATDGQTATVNFSGTYIRTASIIGSVTVERTGLSGVTVRISGTADQATQTDANGQYTFTSLRAGTYEVEVSDFGADVGFSNASQNVTVGVGETEAVSFDGTYVRTAGITGRVAIEGGGLAGVTVSLTGIETRTTTTDAAGQYAFAELRAGAYTVGISGFDAEDYEFTETSKSVNVALGQTSNVPFDGTRLRTAGISGQVNAEGDGIAGVMVALSGAAEAMDTTDAAGQYAFSGLAAGTYMVRISGYDAAAYMFEEDMKTVELADDQAAKANFEGMHTRTASISGQIFLDANENDEMDEMENAVTVAGLTIALLGPGVDEITAAMTDETGMFMFESLQAGVYRVLLRDAARDPKVLAALGWPEGVEFGGSQEGYLVTLTPGGTETRNFPFDITMQTITMKAIMGNGLEGDANKTGAVVEGVGIDLYPTYKAADTERGEIGDMVMTDANGMVEFKFLRAQDTSPDGGKRDYVVFAKVANLPSDDLVTTANDVLEIIYSEYTTTDEADVDVQLLNRRANFQFWVKNIETNVGGDEGQQGWTSEVRTAPRNDGFQSPKASDKNGKVTFSDLLSANALPMKYYIRLAPTQSRAISFGEDFAGTPEPSEVASMETLMVGSNTNAKTNPAVPLLVYEHDGLLLPGETADLGVLRAKWITQTLIVGVHHERTQIRGYDRNIVDGDVRPSDMGADAVSVTLQTRDTHGTPQDWEYDPDPVTGIQLPATKSPNKSGSTDAGLVIFPKLPADEKFIVEARTSSPRKFYGAREVDTFFETERKRDSRGDASSGAFGRHSGTGPLVYICPLNLESTRTAEDRRTNCSTFSYGFTNGRVEVSVATRDYGSAGSPVTAFSSGGKDSVTVMLKPLPGPGYPNFGSTRSRRATANGKSCVEENTDGSLTCTGGTLNFKNVEGGRYELSIMSNSAWKGRLLGSSRTADTLTLFSRADTDGTDQLSEDNRFQVTYQKTQIKGTVANDLVVSSLGQGNGIVHSQETRAGATLTISGTLADGGSFGPATVKTGSDGTFTSPYLPEGRYRVTGQSTDEYELRANNVNPTNRTGFLTTTALTTARVVGKPGFGTGRMITGGTIGTQGDLPRWSYGDHDGLLDQVRSDVALAVLDVQADADFIVLFKDGQLSGRVTQPDDFGKAASARDSDTDPDPYVGVTVRLVRCGDIGVQATALAGFATGLGHANCNRLGQGNVDESFGGKSATTNSAGVYTFENLKEGWYAASVDLTGVNYDPASPTHLDSYIRLLHGPRDSDTFFTLHVQRTN